MINLQKLELISIYNNFDFIYFIHGLTPFSQIQNDFIINTEETIKVSINYSTINHITKFKYEIVCRVINPSTSLEITLQT